MPRSAPRRCSDWGWASSRETAPELELVGVLLPEGAGAALVLGFADYVVVRDGVQVEGGLEAVLHQGDGQVGNVDAEPVASQLLRRRHRRAAAAEGVEHHVALVGGCGDDALQQGLGFLGGVAETFFGLGRTSDEANIGSQYIAHWGTPTHFIQDRV